MIARDEEVPDGQGPGRDHGDVDDDAAAREERRSSLSAARTAST